MIQAIETEISHTKTVILSLTKRQNASQCNIIIKIIFLTNTKKHFQRFKFLKFQYFLSAHLYIVLRSKRIRLIKIYQLARESIVVYSNNTFTLSKILRAFKSQEKWL